MVQQMDVARDHNSVTVKESYHVVSSVHEASGSLPAQSQSFNALMNSLLSHPGV